MIPTTEVRLRAYKSLGTYFGYPQCCVDAFIERVEQIRKTGQVPPPRKLIGTGYVPCDGCNEKSEEELVATIHLNRISSTPFPIENEEEIEVLWKQAASSQPT